MNPTNDPAPADDEWAGPEGETREEFLDLMEENLDDGNVLMENDFWLVEDDAITEVGADEVERLKAATRAYLKEARAELDARGRP